MSNTIDSEKRLKEIGGINFGEAFKKGQITSTFSIPASVSIPYLSDEEKAKREFKNYWAAYKSIYKRENSSNSERYESLSPSELINIEKNKGTTSLSNILGSAKSTYDTITNAPNVIADSLAVGAGQVVGTAMGNAGAIAGQVAGMGALVEGSAQFAADLVSMAITDITSYATKCVADRLVALVMPPSIGEVMGKAAKVCADYIILNTKIEIANLLINSEETSKITQNLSIVNQVAKIANSITKATGKIKDFINDYLGNVQTIVNEMKNHIGNGKQWLQDKVDDYSEDIKNEIKDFIDENTLKLLEKKQQAIDGLGFAIGESLGKAVVTTTKKLFKNNLDKVREKLNNIIIIAKAKIGKIRMNIMAKIGA